MVLELLLTVACAIVLVPVGILVLETLAALLPLRRTVLESSLRAGGSVPASAPAAAPPPRIAVLVPAHDEAPQIGATLRALLPPFVAARVSTLPSDRAGPAAAGHRLIVIADNCSDGTAAEARAAGAEGNRDGEGEVQVQVEVIERQDPDRRGKGFAIAFGLRHLEADPPDVVVLIDADCHLAAGSLFDLARLAGASGRPVQAEYLLRAVPDPSPLGAIGALAVLVRNRVRPRGLHRLGLPCHLTGSGMAFPWRVLRDAPETEGNLVEDLVMGLEMALAGTPPLLCPEVRITSELPAGRAASATQRKRWEHGQLHTLATYVPRLLARGLLGRSPALVALGLDLLVPPLALLVLVEVLVAAAAWAAAAAGLTSFRPPLLATLGLGGTAAAVVAAWLWFARGTLPVRYLLFIPIYVAWKIPLYVVLALRGRQKTWVRTARRGDPPPGL
jgi:cellulose synthase/poly-beta-1,6-N-acetylglucosamine synthase-like glycosyltransferase